MAVTRVYNSPIGELYREQDRVSTMSATDVSSCFVQYETTGLRLCKVDVLPLGDDPVDNVH
jgi:hypothetical protein